MILPLIVLVYKKVSSKMVYAIYGILFFVILALDFYLIVSMDIGVIPAFNEEFYAKIFMTPWFHLNEYLLGVFTCLLFIKF